LNSFQSGKASNSIDIEYKKRRENMSKPKTAPYGSWKSPITPDLIVSESIGLGSISIDGDNIYWIEVHYQEGGRYVVVRRTPDGRTTELTPAPFNVRTRVYEYGGRAYAAAGDTLYFSNFNGQRLYVQKAEEALRPITPEGDLRYADHTLDLRRKRLLCVREDHRGPGEAVNTIASIDLEGQGEGKVLLSGNDFYSSPRLSPDGSRLAWLTWNHPNMPWDGTELWVGELNEAGEITSSERVAGGIEESIFQPEWSPDGILYFVSDATGWWNLYRQVDGNNELLYEMEAEFGVPQWVVGLSTYGFISADALYCIYEQHGSSHLACLDLSRRELEALPVPYTDMSGIKTGAGKVVFLAGSPTEPTSIVQLDPDTHQIQVLRRSSESVVEPGTISTPEEIEFPTENGLTAYGFFYPPRNQDFQAPEGELPPLLVMSHGGPTGATSSAFNLEIQYWTSRGIAVLDVNYGGSTGYGRAYRERLNGQWGVVDVDDCVNGARYLAGQGRVDGNRLAITGGSAGGFTTLCALTFRDAFKAGASHFGIGDLETFVHDTHKFESRYLDRLVCPYTERKELYHERSAVNYVDHLAVPLILFQGLEDKIVPPNQAETMFAAVREKGLPVAYLPFEGEQHGFRRAENIKRALEAELYFYSKIFGFELADPVEPVKIENLPT
jgi:dipeptidyl aminopeptidase/acylaminoacyl peptidase